MEHATGSVENNYTEDEIMEERYTSFLTQPISNASLKKIRLRYVPDYIRELRNKKDYWAEEYKKYEDSISQKNWKEYQKKIMDEIKKHKTILKNLDKMRRAFVLSDNLNYFSQSIDPERIQSIVDNLKENQSDPEIFFKLVDAPPEQNIDHDNFFHVVYATWSLYGEFRTRPPRPKAVQVKNEQ